MFGKNVSEEQRHLEKNRAFEEAVRAFNRGEGYTSFDLSAGTFIYKGTYWDYNTVRQRAWEIR